jgi:hypothetical protein
LDEYLENPFEKYRKTPGYSAYRTEGTSTSCSTETTETTEGQYTPEYESLDIFNQYK